MRLRCEEKFKLILGLGNKDTKSAIDTALLYTRAGVRFFDFAPEIYISFEGALKKAGFNRDDFTLCVSVAALGDIHARKANIEDNACSGCGLCEKNCPEGAIASDKKSKKYTVEYKKCIGCGICKKNTNCYAISFEYANSEINALKKLLEEGFCPDMVEFHASIPDKNRIISDFCDILSIFEGDISVCINRKFFPIDVAIELLLKMKNLYKAKNYDGSFLVQADGASMNGGAEDVNSTLECILFAKELLEFSKTFGVKLIISGGTNINTPQCLADNFADENDYPIIAYGTYARKIVSNVTGKEAQAKALELFEKTVNV